MIKSVNPLSGKRTKAIGVASLIAFSGYVAGDSKSAVQGEDLLRNRCMGCHIPEAQNPLQLSRISHQRKTPEGWLMTITRMQLVHGAVITDEERQSLVKHLADTQGLAPEESEPYRYVLERRLNHVEDTGPELKEMCARCHSEARVGLQRREQSEWEKLVHFHLGQWPSIEFSAMGRDRDWFGIALNETVPYLSDHFGLDKNVWDNWQAVEKSSLTGSWKLTGHRAGKGAFNGLMTAEEASQDNYTLTFTGEYANGEKVSGAGEAILYSGYEWRANLNVGDESYKQVLAMDKSGNELNGRMFQRNQEPLGIDLQAVRTDQSRVLSVSPTYIESGRTVDLIIHGVNLKGNIDLGEHIKVLKTTGQTKDTIQLKVRADKVSRAEPVTVKVGEQKLEDTLTLYRSVDHVEVTPAYAVARVGGAGGSQEKVKAVFEARAYDVGDDGVAGTDDDVFIGIMPAQWELQAFDEIAIRDRDLEFAGEIDRETGVFTPGDAGPNPDRKYGTNNAGRLKVVANLNTKSKSLSAEAELLVTVQRWNNPPIR